MDPFQGKEILKLKLDGTVCLPILIHDDLAIIGMSKTLKNNLMIYQLRQNKVIYKGKIRKEISALFVQDSFLFVQDNKNYIHTLLLPKPILSKGVQLPGRLISPPILVKGVTYLLTENGFILIWDKLRKQVVKQMELKRFFRHPMLFHQGNLWMCDIQGWIGIIDPESLCTIHQDSLPSPSAITPFQYGDRIMMVLEDQSVMAYTDQPILVSRQFQDKISSIQHTGLSTWLISTLDGKIQLWDKELQSILWETHAVRMIKTAPLIYGNHLYFFTSDRNAFCFISP